MNLAASFLASLLTNSPRLLSGERDTRWCGAKAGECGVRAGKPTNTQKYLALELPSCIHSFDSWLLRLGYPHLDLTLCFIKFEFLVFPFPMRGSWACSGMGWVVLVLGGSIGHRATCRRDRRSDKNAQIRTNYALRFPALSYVGQCRGRRRR